jgi:hypothetical protein
MARDSARGRRLVALTWAGMAEICLAGLILIWSSTSSGAHAGYGQRGSIAVLGLSILLTAVAMVALRPAASRRTAQLAVAAVLAVAAGGVLPLAITDLASGRGGVDFPLALAVVGMAVVPAHLIRMANRRDVEGERA